MLESGKNFEVKSEFVLFKLVFGLYIWIQQHGKSLRHFYCEEFTHQSCDFNEFLPNLKEIRQKKNLPKKLPKSSEQLHYPETIFNYNLISTVSISLSLKHNSRLFFIYNLSF